MNNFYSTYSVIHAARGINAVRERNTTPVHSTTFNKLKLIYLAQGSFVKFSITMRCIKQNVEISY